MTNKVIRDGKVAVLYSPGYGAGWSSWNEGENYLYCPELVEAIELGKCREELAKVAEEVFGEDGYYGGAYQLQIGWLEVDTTFRINEYDGAESIEVFDTENFYVA